MSLALGGVLKEAQERTLVKNSPAAAVDPGIVMMPVQWDTAKDNGGSGVELA